eukprot:TRINITY_DN26879_c0_g1_i1.p1 TRINITY_DN26879_c0_g1~~TRINITY_DN26879_c0_g1_i1.p1  ORF type:complete len:151 (-),score=41.68 TRINITY_DN26879_c0_g1_i1:256-708(-)
MCIRDRVSTQSTGLERQIAFSEGKMSSKLEDQDADMQALRKCNMALAEIRDSQIDQIDELTHQLQSAHVDFVLESDPVLEAMARKNVELSEAAEFMSLRGIFTNQLSSISFQSERIRFEAVSYQLQVAEAKLLRQEEMEATRNQSCCSIM